MWRAGERRVARLVRAPRTGAPPRAPRLDGSILITGGLGDLALHIARQLARRGHKHLVLTGRRGADTPGASEAVRELEALGARVTVAAMDVADRDAIARVLAALPADAPLRGVAHAAAALDDGVLIGQNAERFARVLLPKVVGSWHLHELTKDADLDFYVLFSSLSGTIGSSGQGSYAAANVFLDALAAYRRARGLPAQSLVWGLWTDESGKATGLAKGLDERTQIRFARPGVHSVTPSRGVRYFEAALARSEALLVPVPIEPRELRKALRDVPPLLRALVPARRAPRAKHGDWVKELTLLADARRFDAVLHAVRVDVARALSLSGPEAVSIDRPLREHGIDSLMAVELRNALGRRAAMNLPATLVFDYPTARAIAQYLMEKLFGATESLSPPVPIVDNTADLVAQLTEQELIEQLRREALETDGPGG